jgi:hypothetical protein
LTLLEQKDKQRRELLERTLRAAPEPKQPPEPDPIQAQLDATKAQLQHLKADARDMVRGEKRIELRKEINRLETEVEISAKDLAVFEKEVEKKANEAESAGRTSVNLQMARAEVENIERILRSLREEGERLRLELRGSPRVKVLGDPNAPAAVPECPD